MSADCECDFEWKDILGDGKFSGFKLDNNFNNEKITVYKMVNSKGSPVSFTLMGEVSGAAMHMLGDSYVENADPSTRKYGMRLVPPKGDEVNENLRVNIEELFKTLEKMRKEAPKFAWNYFTEKRQECIMDAISTFRRFKAEEVMEMEKNIGGKKKSKRNDKEIAKEVNKILQNNKDVLDLAFSTFEKGFSTWYPKPKENSTDYAEEGEKISIRFNVFKCKYTSNGDVIKLPKRKIDYENSTKFLPDTKFCDLNPGDIFRIIEEMRERGYFLTPIEYVDCNGPVKDGLVRTPTGDDIDITCHPWYRKLHKGSIVKFMVRFKWYVAKNGHYGVSFELFPTNADHIQIGILKLGERRSGLPELTINEPGATPANEPMPKECSSNLLQLICSEDLKRKSDIEEEEEEERQVKKGRLLIG